MGMRADDKVVIFTATVAKRHQITSGKKAAPTGIEAPPAPECLDDPLDGDASALFSVPPAVGQVIP
jgi:hypothetical protein